MSGDRKPLCGADMGGRTRGSVEMTFAAPTEAMFASWFWCTRIWRVESNTTAWNLGQVQWRGSVVWWTKVGWVFRVCGVLQASPLFVAVRRF